MGEKIVILNEDNKAVSINNLNNLIFTTSQLLNMVKQGTLTDEMQDILPGLIEHYIADASKAIGYNSESEVKIKERHAQVREANIRIQELEALLGSSKPVDGLKEQLTKLTDSVKKWWRIEGFNYIEEMNFSSNGILEVNFGFNFMRCSTYSKTPVADKQKKVDWIKELEEQGYELYKSNRGREVYLVDNDNNKRKVIDLIKNRFPTAKIIEWKDFNIYEEKEQYQLKRVKVYIYDLKEAHALEEYLDEFKEVDED